MNDEYRELFANGLSGSLSIDELVIITHGYNLNNIPDEVGEQLNTDITNKLIEDSKG